MEGGDDENYDLQPWGGDKQAKPKQTPLLMRKWRCSLQYKNQCPMADPSESGRSWGLVRIGKTVISLSNLQYTYDGPKQDLQEEK